MKLVWKHLLALSIILTVASCLLPGCTNTTNGNDAAVHRTSDMQTVWGSGGGGSGKPINGPEQDYAPSRR